MWFNDGVTKSKIIGYIPEEIAEVIKKCWAKEPKDRPHTISDVSERLKLINWN